MGRRCWSGARIDWRTGGSVLVLFLFEEQRGTADCVGIRKVGTSGKTRRRYVFLVLSD